jgi:hypothetical protein
MEVKEYSLHGIGSADAETEEKINKSKKMQNRVLKNFITFIVKPPLNLKFAQIFNII